MITKEPYKKHYRKVARVLLNSQPASKSQPTAKLQPVAKSKPAANLSTVGPTMWPPIENTDTHTHAHAHAHAHPQSPFLYRYSVKLSFFLILLK